MGVLPIFPLGAVLLPGAGLPLNIFEPRYRQLMADVLAGPDRGRFGVVALNRGSEVDRDVAFAPVGTVAEIMEHERFDDGTYQLFAVGSRRFRILGVDEASKPYLQAEVEWLGEDEGERAVATAAAASALFTRYERVLSALSGRPHESELGGDAIVVSYEIAGGLQLPVAERQDLLAAETAAARLRAELRLLRREIVLMRRTRSIPVALQALRIVPSAS